MAEHTLTREKILDAAEDTLRRFGPAKTTVVDVARLLGVSHGSVYRHFPSKAGLRDAVVDRWLGRVTDQLVPIVKADAPAPARLRQWIETLTAIKRARRVSPDKEMFETYRGAIEEARTVIEHHVQVLRDQLATIIAAGVKDGTFTPIDPAIAARAFLQATAAFHVPAMASTWDEADADAQLKTLVDLVIAGLERR